MERKFKDLYLAGEVEFEAIDDYSYEWGMSDEECTLAQYLGLNEEEEDAWVSDSEDALKELLDKQKGISYRTSIAFSSWNAFSRRAIIEV